MEDPRMFDKSLPTDKLIQAIINRDDVELKQAIDEGADVNADRSGNTPLILAASHDNAQAFNALLDAGANPNQPNHHGLTPAHEAARRGLSDLLERLAQNPMIMLSRNNKAGNTPAHMAATAGHLDCLKVLAGAKAALDEPGKEGKTPLMLAIDRQDMEMTRLLLDNGARVDIQDEAGLTARERLVAWPAAASLAVSSTTPSSTAPSAEVADVQDEDEPETAEATSDDFMGIGAIRKRRPSP